MWNLKVKVTYDAGKLERSLPRILEEYGKMAAESLAKDARARIENGIRPKLEDSTKDISKNSLSGKRPYPRTSNKPLIHTGSLLASIKANTGDNNGEVEVNAYIEPHLTGYKVKQNKWSIRFNTQGKDVPRRNPFSTPSGRLYKSVGMKDHLKELHKLIHKAFKGKGRWLSLS